MEYQQRHRSKRELLEDIRHSETFLHELSMARKSNAPELDFLTVKR